MSFDYNHPLARQMAQRLLASGYTPEQTAGWLGNAVQESSLNPNALNEQEGAFGLFQWRNSRRDELENYARENQFKIDSLDAQLGYLLMETGGTEARADELIRATTTPAEAATAIDHHFERSSREHTDARIRHAEGFMEHLMPGLIEAAQAGDPEAQAVVQESAMNLPNVAPQGATEGGEESWFSGLKSVFENEDGSKTWLGRNQDPVAAGLLALSQGLSAVSRGDQVDAAQAAQIGLNMRARSEQRAADEKARNAAIQYFAAQGEAGKPYLDMINAGGSAELAFNTWAKSETFKDTDDDRSARVDVATADRDARVSTANADRASREAIARERLGFDRETLALDHGQFQQSFNQRVAEFNATHNRDLNNDERRAFVEDRSFALEEKGVDANIANATANLELAQARLANDVNNSRIANEVKRRQLDLAEAEWDYTSAQFDLDRAAAVGQKEGLLGLYRLMPNADPESQRAILAMIEAQEDGVPLPDYVIDQAAEMFKQANPDGIDPTAAMKNWAFMQTLSPEDRKRFLEMQGENTTLNLGDTSNTLAYKSALKYRDTMRENASVLQDRAEAAKMLVDLMNTDAFKEGHGLEQYTQPMQRILRSFGFLTDEQAATLSADEMFAAISNRVFPSMRPVGSGATSDFEARTYRDAFLTLGNSEEANRLLAQRFIAESSRQVEKITAYENYIASNGGSDSGWDAHWKERLNNDETLTQTVYGQEREGALEYAARNDKLIAGQTVYKTSDGSLVILTQPEIDRLRAIYGSE